GTRAWGRGRWTTAATPIPRATGSSRASRRSSTRSAEAEAEARRARAPRSRAPRSRALAECLVERLDVDARVGQGARPEALGPQREAGLARAAVVEQLAAVGPREVDQ